ncbi:MAG TPA: NAD-dependent epimerase/dehydratase family protein [Roseiflexaceae bacterium]|nr:NAD-dependent epimerase/dehydratase family protein [Roseiflexaceae bacterium]
MGRYLIAGAAGYVGTRLAEHMLARGHSVRALVRDSESDAAQRLAALGAAIWQADVTQPESLMGVASGIEHVYNLTSRFVLENGSVRRLYVEGNRNLIAACSRSRSVRSYIFTSSTAPYGDRGDEWLTEDTPVAPNYPLAETLVAAEQVLLDAARQHAFPAIILRVGAIYGPGRDPIEAVRSGTATLIGDGRNFLPHIHVEDLVAALERVAAEGQPGAIYNVVDDEPMRSAAFYGEIRRRLGMVPPRAFPKEAALFAGMDPSVVGVASSSARVSNQRLKQELGVTLRYPSFRTWLDEQLADVERALGEPELAMA